MNSFKISFDFGYIVETVRYDEDGIQEVTYDIRYPHNNILNALNPESLIDSQEKLEKFIQYLPAKIIGNQERTVEDTHTRFVAIVSMVVVVYRNRAGGAAPAELQKYIQRQEVKFVDNMNYRNNCLFDALSFISLPDDQTKRKSSHIRVAEGKRLMKQFYSAIGIEQVKNFTEFLENYQGFDLASEGKQLANIFNINICVYAYHHLDFEDENEKIEQTLVCSGVAFSNEIACKIASQPERLRVNCVAQIPVQKLNSKGNRVHRKKEDRIINEKYDNYFLDFVIKPENNEFSEMDLDPASEIKEPKDFNILLVHFRNKFHILYISDTLALTGLAYCPICKLHAVKVNDQYGNWDRDLRKHIEQCKQNNGKQVKLSGNQIPFAPHITGNKTYEYFWSRQELHKFKPTKYYITYDFETMEEQINKYFGKATNKPTESACTPCKEQDNAVRNSFQNSALVPLSVASTIKSKKELKSIYFDVRSNVYATSVASNEVCLSVAGEKILTQNFIQQWLEALFEEAQQVKQDNMYDDPDVPYDIAVPVLGFNSAHFDMIFVLPYLTSSKWHITNYLGDFSRIKRVEVRHKITGVRIQFLDAELFVTKMKLKDFAKDFGKKSNKRSQNKGIFPYTAFNTTNYEEVLNISSPFEQKEFFNELTQQNLSNSEYTDYLLDQSIIIVNKNGKVTDTIKKFNNRWDYLQYYNELDTQIMIEPIDNLIKMNFNNDLDMFNYLSMASCANGTKYKMCCDDLDLNSRYINRDDQALIQFTPFELTQEHWNKKVANYNMQDTKAGRDTKDNVNQADFEYFRDIIKGGQCWFCEVRFTNKNPPTLDRIDNSLGYSKNNVQLACQWCNVKRGNRDPFITKGLIQLKRYYLAKGLPMPLTDEDTYHKLRPNITGGLANAFHRYNVKDETHINKLKFEGQYVVSYDLDHIMTHVCGYDFNSLQPSVMSGIPHDFIKYTGKRIYMPGYELDRIECETENQKQLGLKIINNPLRFSNKQSEIDRVTVFVAEVKGHIDYKYINDYINYPPIIRKYKYKTLESVIGDFMHQHMKNNSLKTGGEENKLTVLLSTM
ncbi:MAG: hypothetical protein EZS28_024163 [Streblomastix strix]|uniref:Uncharacterized protein n=1 Tax=Streblomastix strix TaxID=222440 RepID=A0A5J4VCR8_9EUKA|nr:MAG: hypothetical protein EZS28_024163 [Streblomastix strix]